MPKKTKKHKLKASKLHASRVDAPFGAKPKATTHVTETLKAVSHPQIETHAHFKEELTKSLMITLLIICTQVGLYILQISGRIDISNVITF